MPFSETTKLLQKNRSCECGLNRGKKKNGVFLEGVFFAVPNGGKRTSRQAAWLKEEGMKAGVSDMLLLKRTSQYGFLCIENKTPKGRQEPEQKVFQFEVERHGGKYIIVRSIDEFIQSIDNYLNGEL